jgi:general transcription factor 3C protein 4
MQLRKEGRLLDLQTPILDILRRQLPEIPNTFGFNPWEKELTLPLQQAFQRSLTRHLFGWDIILSLRMRLAVADFCWVTILKTSFFVLLTQFFQKLAVDDNKQIECGEVAQYLLNDISYRVLRAIIRHLTVISSLFDCRWSNCRAYVN